MGMEKTRWQLGASVKDFERLEEYAAHFSFLEIDLSVALKAVDPETVARLVSECSSTIKAVAPAVAPAAAVTRHLRRSWKRSISTPSRISAVKQRPWTSA